MNKPIRAASSGLSFGVAGNVKAKTLPEFIAQHPGCSLHLQVFPTHLYMEDLPFDVGVQYDDAVWPGANALPLMGEPCVVVCSPKAK
eukprot:gene55164-73695_t